ncbi:hypothetical protein MSAN_00221300 [Mycena sanguinolenta]|uniref:Autophagy-related protein 27 n=1 Tax=Mycena sanguinolenta TaxID=230812 RepID=A0A8H6ZII3_9AGAR|nr:hypothetical protein MSAN_00221300 [Mycena sanguinolenta]
MRPRRHSTSVSRSWRSRESDRRRTSTHHTMMFSLFAAIITAAAAAPGLFRHTPILIDSTEVCQFSVGSKQYNLCPIFRSAAWQSLLPVKGDETEYRSHLGLDSDNDHPSDDPRLPGTRTRIGVNSAEDPSGTPMGSHVIVVDTKESDEFITLRFGGDAEHAADVQLICDSQIQLGEPVFLGLDNDLHHFIWRTKHACKTGLLPTDDQSNLNALDMESDSPPSDDNSDPSEPEEGEDQLLDSDRQRQLRRSTAIIFAVIFIIIISLSIISYRHSDRLNSFFSTNIKPIFHRLSLDHLPRFSLPHSLKPAGESRLVRWAQEDLELDEDIMVNGSDAYYEPEDTNDENIPLRPSPRKGGRFKNYGTATSPFW